MDDRPRVACHNERDFHRLLLDGVHFEGLLVSQKSCTQDRKIVASRFEIDSEVSGVIGFGGDAKAFRWLVDFDRGCGDDSAGLILD